MSVPREASSARDPATLVLGLGQALLRIEEKVQGAQAEYDCILGQLRRVGRAEAMRVRGEKPGPSGGRGRRVCELGDPPSPGQARMLRAVGDWIASHGYPPTTREIGIALGIRSTNAVIEALVFMERKGLVAREPKISRSVRVTEMGRAFLDRDVLLGVRTKADVAVEAELEAAGVTVSPEDERTITSSWGLDTEESR